MHPPEQKVLFPRKSLQLENFEFVIKNAGFFYFPCRKLKKKQHLRLRQYGLNFSRKKKNKQTKKKLEIKKKHAGNPEDAKIVKFWRFSISPISKTAY